MTPTKEQITKIAQRLFRSQGEPFTIEKLEKILSEELAALAEAPRPTEAEITHTKILPADRAVAHRCNNFRAYPSLLCSCCKEIGGDLSVRELCSLLNATPSRLTPEVEAEIAKIEEAYNGTDKSVLVYRADHVATDIGRLITLLRQQGGDDWRSMDSAPKDGTRIILGNARDVWQGYWDVEEEAEGGQCWRLDDADMQRFDIVFESAPTCWQSLPRSSGERG